MKVAAPWMTTSTVVVDTLPLGDKLDNKMGRTDIIVRNRMTRLMEIRHWMERARSSIEFPRTLASPRPETSGRLTGSTQDRAVIDALKKMWTQIPEDEDKVERRSSIQLGKNFRNISQVFAIKGAGQTLMPTDFVNAGCLCWSRIVSEGERRVLDRPLRGPMSLWNLSMMMARRSLQLSGKQNQATSRKPNEAQACAELQASGDTSEAPQAVDGCRVPPGLLPYSYDPVEKSRLAEMYEERGVGEGKCKCEVEERNQRDAAGSNKEKDLLRPERRRCTSLVLCEIDNASDAESEKSPQERQSDNKDTYTFERIPEEHAEMEIGADATEFFKSLEISHSEEVLAAEKHKLKPCTSDVFIRDSGLSSFGLDVYVSNECTSNEPDSLMDDANSEHQRQVHSSTDLGSVDGSLRSYVDDGDAVTSLRSNKELEDEGFTELDRACKSACMWDEMPIGPLPEDESDIGEGNGRRAYWKVLQHSRQMALPLLTARQEKLQPTQPDPQIMTQMPKSSTPDLYEQKRDTAECNDIPHYIKSLSSPPAPTTEETLGHLYEQHEDSNCWQYWLKGDRLSEGFDAGESSSLDEGSNDDMSTTDLNAYSSEACMVNPQTTRFNIDALEAVPCDSTPSKLSSSHAFVESSIENLSINRTAIGKGEGGDASNCEEKSCDCFQEDLNAPSPPGNIADLLDVPFEDLNIMERRVMAQALESEWGRMSSAENCREGGPKSRRAITEDKLVVRDALLCPRRFYRAARHSVSDLYHLVDRGSRAVDRRAMARQAERMWGRAASSRCR